MCLFVCFEAGRFTQTQSSRTVVCRSRKWMSGHAGYAAALAQFQTDPFRQITATVTPSTSTLREILPLGPGRGVFSLDKSLSWRSYELPDVPLPAAVASGAESLLLVGAIAGG